MGEKELYVLEYVNQRINGNEDIKYNCDIEEEYAVNEIAHYLKRLLSKRYVIGKDWAVTKDQDVSKYENNVVSIDYKKLTITSVGIKEMKKAIN
jgi:hypothetical protein